MGVVWSMWVWSGHDQPMNEGAEARGKGSGGMGDSWAAVEGTKGQASMAAVRRPQCRPPKGARWGGLGRVSRVPPEAKTPPKDSARPPPDLVASMTLVGARRTKRRHRPLRMLRIKPLLPAFCVCGVFGSVNRGQKRAVRVPRKHVRGPKQAPSFSQGTQGHGAGLWGLCPWRPAGCSRRRSRGDVSTIRPCPNASTAAGAGPLGTLCQAQGAGGRVKNANESQRRRRSSFDCAAWVREDRAGGGRGRALASTKKTPNQNSGRPRRPNKACWANRSGASHQKACATPEWRGAGSGHRRGEQE